MTIPAFRRLVWGHYKKHGRHGLPWRKTRDPYRILVSEVMLQQTQVERVIPFYTAFIERFPTARSLSEAPLSAVLAAWQGLGYNRRAKMLREAAGKMGNRKRFSVPELEALPGVGPYTARAVAAFAYGEDGIFIETNIRTAVIHHFFPKRKKVADADMEKILTKALPKGKSREWYSALMDYGAFLKRSGVSHNAKSRSYARQSKFAGSLREARGAVLKKLVAGSASKSTLLALLGTARKGQVGGALRALLAEGFVEVRGKRYRLSGSEAARSRG